MNKIIRIIIVVLAALLLISGIGFLVINFIGGSSEEETPEEIEEETENDAEEIPETVAEVSTIRDIPESDLESGRFYVKSNGKFYQNYGRVTTIATDNLVTSSSDPTRILSYTSDNVNIPTMYSDDSLIFYSDSEVPVFYWEHFKDYGYTIGIYNLQLTAADKVTYTPDGVSSYNPESSIYTPLAEAASTGGTIIIDKVAGKYVTEDTLTPSGSITGLTKDEPVVVDLYVGTELYQINVLADTHVLGSCETFQTTGYTLSPEGYAYLELPSDLISGYYMVNGRGLFRYIDHPRSQGEGNEDFSKEYYIKENGKTYTPSEYEEMMREKEAKESDG